MSRYVWTHLDPRVRAEIEERTDRVDEVHPHHDSTGSDIVATLGLVSRCRVVIKGVRWRHAQPAHLRAVQMQKEALVLGHIPGAFAPGLLAMVDCADWLMLVLEHIPGTTVNLSPGSPDVAAVVKTLATLAARPGLSPTAMRTVPALSYSLLGIRPWRQLRHARPPLHGWVLGLIDEWADRELELIRLCEGDSLVHSAIERADLLLTQRDVSVLDWSHAHTAPPWVDLATVAVLLIEHGHRPAAAEELVAPAPVWADADQDAIIAHAVVSYGVWELRHRTCTDEDHSAVAAKADAWLRWAHYQWSRYRSQPAR